MEQSILEKRIKEKAEKRFKDELQKAKKILDENDILGNLEIHGETISPSCSNHGWLCSMNIEKNDIKNTNFKELKENLIKEYVEEETDKILDQLENFNYLFNQ